MASGAVLGRYRQLYTRADRAIQQWDALHVSAECLRTCTCAAQRSQGWQTPAGRRLQVRMRC